MSILFHSAVSLSVLEYFIIVIFQYSTYLFSFLFCGCIFFSFCSTLLYYVHFLLYSIVLSSLFYSALFCSTPTVLSYSNLFILFYSLLFYSKCSLHTVLLILFYFSLLYSYYSLHTVLFILFYSLLFYSNCSALFCSVLFSFLGL